MKNTGVYVISNKENNKRYVGSANNLKGRLSYHRTLLERNKHPNKHLQRSYNKYGKDAFIFKVLLYCDEFSRLMYEQMFIDKLLPEYNNVKIAGSTLGYKHSNETREKMKRNHSHKSFQPTEQWREKQKLARLGTKHSDEHKEKIREGVIAYWKERREQKD